MPLDFFTKSAIENDVPSEMEPVVRTLQATSSKNECLKKAYEILIDRYHGQRTKTYLQVFKVFESDTDKLWRKTGFLHCTNINYLLRTLLTKSGHFIEDDIRLRWCLIWYLSPHQYVQVKVGSAWIDVDIWAQNYGIDLGDHAHGFH